jgi:hypothetical protein
MTMIKNISILFISLILMSACNGPSNVVFLTKPYTKDLVKNDADLNKGLIESAAKHGFGFSIKEIENETPSILSTLIKSSKASVFLIDPMLATLPEDIASDSPQALFISYGSEPRPGSKAPKNLLVVQNEYDTGLSLAGEIAGIVIGDPKFKARLSPKMSTAPSFGVLSTNARPDSQAIIPKIKSGFTRMAKEELFESFDAPAIGNAEDINKAVKSMYDKNVRLFYLHLYSQNINVLDSLRRLGAFAVLEDWDPARGYDDVVVFGISEDLPLILQKALSVYKRDNKAISWKAREMTLPLKIEWGSVIPISTDIKAIIAGPMQN